MNRDNVLRILKDAHQAGRRPLLNCADLRGADLSYTDLRRADLRDADLSEADLRGAYLRDAYLCDADLSEADLRGADLCDADLRRADLSDADLRDTDLSGADLRYAQWAGLVITNGYRGYDIHLMPTKTGWHVRVGCWVGTIDELQTLIDSDEGWPETRPEYTHRQRPTLQTAINYMQAHIATVKGI